MTLLVTATSSDITRVEDSIDTKISNSNVIKHINTRVSNSISSFNDNYLHLSGGTITGNLIVDEDVAIDGNLYGHSDTILADVSATAIYADSMKATSFIETTNLGRLNSTGFKLNIPSGRTTDDSIARTSDLTEKADLSTLSDYVPFVDSVYGRNAVTIGLRNPVSAVGFQSLAIGNLVIAAGGNSQAEGDRTSTAETANASHAEGSETKTLAPASHSEGGSTTAVGVASHAEGLYTKASGVGAHSEGTGLDSFGEMLETGGADAALVSLFKSNATAAAGDLSHTEGIASHTSAIGSHASGFKTNDSGNPFSFVWQGYSGSVPTNAEMQALVVDPGSALASNALQKLATALGSTTSYTSNGPGTFNINPVGGADGIYIGLSTLTQIIQAEVARALANQNP